MWIADNWKDYEILDCSGGEKLERWGTDNVCNVLWHFLPNQS